MATPTRTDSAALSLAAMATKASTLLRAARKASLASRAAAAAASRAAAMASHSARAAGVAADVACAARSCLDLICHPKSCSNRRFPTSADYEHLPGGPDDKAISATTEELAKGVQDMAVDDNPLKLSEKPLFGAGPANSDENLGSESEMPIKEKVSDNSAATSLSDDDLTMAEKIQQAKITKDGLGVESKGISKSGGKHGKNKKLSSAKILGSMKGVQSKGSTMVEKVETLAGGGSSARHQQMDVDSAAALDGLDVDMLSPAKRGKLQHE